MGKLVGLLGVLALVVLGFMAFNNYNTLVDRDEAVKTAWAQVENVYQRRADLIPNLVETVRGAANFEQETLESVVSARSRIGQISFDGAPSPAQLEQFQAAQSELSSSLGRLLAVAEDYPELGATEAFRDLQSQLEGTENRITVERRRFNEVARDYNTTRRRFPASLFASVFGFEERAYFEAAQEAERAPAVDFSTN